MLQNAPNGSESFNVINHLSLLECVHSLCVLVSAGALGGRFSTTPKYRVVSLLPQDVRTFMGTHSLCRSRTA